MAKRGISNGQRVWLASQLDDWQSQNAISAEQAVRILDLYETKTDLAERQRSAAMLTLMGVAAFLVGLGALLLVGYNWAAMPAALKLLIIFGVTIGTHGTAFVLRFKRHAKMMSEVVFFLGCLFYGAGIFLVAQIFHVNAHYPDGMWWWSLGVLPFALCLDSLLLHTLLVALLAIWCGMEIIGFGQIGMWWLFGRWGFIANGAYLLPLLALPGLWRAYRNASVAAVTLYVALLGWWVILQPFAWGLKQETIYYIGAVGGLMLAMAESHPTGSRFAIPYRQLGALLAAGVLLMMSFYQFNTGMTSSRFEGSSLVLAVVILVISAAMIGVIAGLNRRESSASLSILQIQGMLRRQWLPIGLALLMVVLLIWRFLVAEPLLPTIVANAAMIFLAFWLIGVGLREDRGQPFAAGVLYFLLWAVVRYVDLFGGFGGMLGAATMFFLCGGALFGVAFYWRHRRQLQHV